jgi:WD40 repeat protein
LLIQNRYRIIKLISQGGFGKTFLAVDESKSPPSRCVIKQFLLQNQAPESVKKARELFEQEALRLQELGKHPQIPALIDSFAENETLYLVQEFIEGTNLAKVVEEEGTFSQLQIWQLLEDLLPVLKFIHERKVIHRDIKPANIILSSPEKATGRFVLVDFGAAKLVTEIDAFKIGTSIGSAEYVAPEQAKGKAVFASDLYSLGVSCIYLLTGISPFNLYDVVNDGWIWQEYAPEKVSDRLTQILDKLIQNPLNCRFESADAVLQAMGIPSPIPNPTSQLKNHLWQCIGTLSRHGGLSAGVNAVAISPDGAILASGSEDKTARLWRVETGEAIATLSGHTNFVNSVAFSPDNTMLATASDDRTIKLWDLTNYQEICTLSAHSRPVKSVAFSPDNRLLASGSWDKTIKLWDVATKALLCTLKGHKLQVSAVAFSPNAQYLASASFDRTVLIWDLKTSQTLPPYQMLSGHLWPVLSVAFSPNGETIATGSDDKTVKFWNLATGQATHSFLGHSWAVAAVAFSPNGETLISGSWDKTIKVLRVNTGEEIDTLAGHLDAICAIAFSPNGQIVASGSKDRTIKLWRHLG